MTPEEKQLLLKDICARLPYGVLIHVEGFIGGNYLNGDSKLIGIHNGIIHVENQPTYGNYEGFPLSINIKPYLRPISSLIGKELDECRATCKHRQEGQSVLDCATPQTIDYLISHHFDFRGLIPMGLALEAKEGMYKTE